MDKNFLQTLLIDVAEGRLTPEEASDKLKTLPYEDMDFVKIDTHRALRTGRGEVIFGIGKTPAQVAAIMKRMSSDTSPVVATKVGPEYYEAAKAEIPEGLEYHEQARLLVYQTTQGDGPISGDGPIRGDGPFDRQSLSKGPSPLIGPSPCVVWYTNSLACS